MILLQINEDVSGMSENRVLCEGVQCLTLPDPRFKTALLTVALFLPLAEDTVEQYALLPRLLIRGCEAYPDFTALNRRLNQLYGASVTGDVARVGEAQAIVLTAECTSDRYALKGEALTASCAQLLCDMLFRPVLQDGVFREEDVNTERRCLSEDIRSEINEKQWYARRQAERLLCPNEVYGIGRYGSADTVEALTAQKMTEAWKRVLREATVRVILQDEGELPAVEKAFREAFSAVQGRAPVTVDTVTQVKESEVRRKVERMEVGQSKLVLGFRTDCAEPQPEVPAMRLMNALLGGTASSLLFRNVREKLSLCYYCSSTYDRIKGVMLVQSGVDEANAEKAEAEILKQIDAIRAGEFTDDDVEAARRSVIQSFESFGDSQQLTSAWYVAQGLSEQPQSPRDCKAQIEAVTKEQVIDAAKRIRFECAYLLAQKEGEAHG